MRLDYATTTEKKTGRGKGAISYSLLLTVILGVAWAGWSTWQKYNGGAANERPRQTASAPSGRPAVDPAQRANRFKQTLVDLNLTSDQQAKVDALLAQGNGQGREGWQARKTALDQILTPAQAQQLQAKFAGGGRGRMEQMTKTLDPKDREILTKRFEARDAARGSRGGNPGGPAGTPPEARS